MGIVIETKRLNLGCGNDIREGWVNADYPWSQRPGPAPFPLVWGEPLPWDEEFDHVLLGYVLNHVPLGEVHGLLSEVWRVLRNRGVLEIREQDCKWFYENGVEHPSLPIYEDDPIVAQLVPNPGGLNECSYWNTYPERVAHYAKNFFNEVSYGSGDNPAAFWVMCTK